MEEKGVKVGNEAVKLTASKLITTLIGLISAMLLSRFRTLAEFGTYSQLLLAINLACSIFMLGLPNSINYFLAKADSKEERAEFLSVYYTLSTLLSFLIGLILVLSCPLLERFFKNTAIKYFWYFLALYPWTKVIMAGVENLLIVYRKTSLLVVFRVLNSAMLLGIIIFIRAINGSFNQYMVLLSAVEIIFTLWVYVLVKRNGRQVTFSLDRKLIADIFRFSLPIGLSSVIGTLNIELDKLVITSFLTTESLAIYTNASRELPVKMITASLTAVLMPQIVRLLKQEKKEAAVKLWNSATTISFAFISLLAVGCFTFAPEVMTLLYSAKYLSGAGVFRIYCLTLLFRCTYFGMLLNAGGNTKFLMYSSLASLVVNMVLNYPFFYLFGMIGPALATLIAVLTIGLYQLAYTCKKAAISFSKIFPWQNCAFFLAVNSVCALLFYGLKDLIHRQTMINNNYLAILLGLVWSIGFIGFSYKRLKKEWFYLNKER